MPQETNLNINPYNDDYSPADAYYKVLFKPNPVQARELNNLQSILQNQIEQFGNHIFKEGSVVIPGNVDYDNDVSAVELQNSYNGVDVSTYLPLLNNKTIRGKNSGVRAIVTLSLTQDLSPRKNNTIYVKYLSSNLTTGVSSLFSDGEELIIEDSSTETLSTGEIIVFTSGQTIAATISSNCNSTASTVSVTDGVYFIRGTFVNVFAHTILLDPYFNNVSCKVGFSVNEKIITSYDNEALFDNASGFSNYTAPGADRFSIELILTKYDLTEEKPSNFVKLLEIQNGVLISSQEIPQYNVLEQQLARRTFNESGDYYVTQPSVSISESLDDLQGNNGIYNSSSVTYSGNTPSESLGIYQVSPFQAFVRGYEVKTGASFIDFEKPRTTKLLENQEVNYYTGPTLTLNRVFGTPVVGVTTNYIISLRNSRVSSNQNTSSGKEIGLARVYDFALESGSYTTSNLSLNEWDLSLFDVQPYTEIILNQNLDNNLLYNVPCQIVGKSSGATAFLRYDARNIGIITAYDVKGTFATGEKLIFNGIENTRVSTAVTSYSLDDVKSVYGIVGSAFTFTADVKQIPGTLIGQVNITAFDSVSGVSTVTKTGTPFSGLVSVGNLVSFSTPGISTVNYARVSNVSFNAITITGVTTVNGICEGKLPTTTINPSNFTVLSSSFSRSQDNTLYTKFAKERISDVNLRNSNLTIRKQIDVNISSNSIGPINSDTNETFLPFDEERYALIREDGTTEVLTSDKFVFSNGSQTLTINGLGSASKAKLTATLRRINVTEKVKYKNRIKKVVVDKSKYASSGVGTTSFNDGLSYGNFPYGTRVQDTEICLLSPDVTKIYGIFESSTSSSASLPNLTLSALSGPTNKTDDLLVGEKLIGSSSKSVAIFVEKINDLTISVVYLNSSRFTQNEPITFEDTGITANIVSVSFGDSNITSNFTFDSGQKSTIYDYSKIIRKANVKEPTRKLTIICESADFLTSDVGDVVTVNSYNNFDYCDLPQVDGIPVSDIIDVRPRVSNYTVAANTYSPFEFLGRDFSSSYLNPKNILASDESINLDYSFYLPRIDNLFLTKAGEVKLVSGAPSETPQPPNSLEDSIEMASVYLPSYLCDIGDAEISLTTHKRYRMEDIKKLEDRISNLEYYTSLSLLESDTSKLFIPNENNINRFKSGFFVDNFSSREVQQELVPIRNSIDLTNNELRPSVFTTELDLVIASKSIIGIGTVADTLVDLQFNTDLLGSNIKKTGNLLTLDYDEVQEIIQPYSTRIENVASYRNNIFSGSVTLSPSSDVWVDQIKTTAKIVSAKPLVPTEQEKNIQNGLNPSLWNSVQQIWAQGNTLLSSQIAQYLRSRNIGFTAKRMKPFTRLYTYFDNRGMERFVVPKLLEILMVSGTFQVGETVIGTNPSTGVSIIFRVAKSNHKYGPYDSPTTFYTQNPYSNENVIPANYSSTSTILNIDIYSLSNISQGNFGGFIDSGMRLKGQTSGAEATINSDIKLISDTLGDVIGSLFIPNGNVQGYPAFESGTKLFRLTNSPTNSLIEGVASSFAETNFVSSGNILNYQENVVGFEPSSTVIQTPNTTPNGDSQFAAPQAEATQTQVERPWRDGDIIIRGGRRNISNAEGTRLVESINSKNGTSFTLEQLKNAAGVRRLDQISELQRMNAAARRLAGR